MAYVRVTPNPSTGPVDVSYSGGTRLIFSSGSERFTVERSTSSGVFRRTLEVGDWLIRLRRSGNTVAQASVEVAEPEPVWQAGTVGINGAPPIEHYLLAGHQVVHSLRTFSGYAGPAAIVASGTNDGIPWTDPSIQKVIRGCDFRDAGFPAMRLASVVNLLLYECRIDNLRTTIGQSFSAFAATGTLIDKLVIVKCQVGPGGVASDFIQFGGGSNAGTREALLEYNTWLGPGEHGRWGENAVDIKGCQGPITVRYNEMGNWYPCPPGTRDCSGDPGCAMVIHDGKGSGAPHNVSVYGNVIFGNRRDGMRLSDETGQASGIDIGPNTWRDHAGGDHFANRMPSGVRIATAQDIDSTAHFLPGSAARY